MLFPSILSRYLIVSFLRWFGVVSIGLSFIVLLFDTMELVRKTSGKTFIGFDIVFQMAFLKLPALLEQLLPFIILFSGILAFWHLNRQNEVIIIRASGISVSRILRPLFVCSLFLGILDLVVVNPLSSSMMLRYEQLHDRYFRGNTGGLAVSESGLWLREVDDTIQSVFHVGRLSSSSGVLLDVSIFQTDLNDRFLRRLDSKTATFEENSIRLNDVWVVAPGQPPEFVPVYVLPTSLNMTNLKTRGADPQSLSFWRIPQYLELLEKSGLNGSAYRLYWHGMIARVAWLGVMIVLAATCALRPVRQGNALLLIALGILGAFALYFLRDISSALGSSGKIPLVMAAWVPVLIGCFSGIALLLHFEEG